MNPSKEGAFLYLFLSTIHLYSFLQLLQFRLLGGIFMSDETSTKKKDAGKMGLVGLTALIISAMVGSGVFDLPKNMSAVAGMEAQVYAWITTGIGIWFIAEMFVILSDTQPNLTAGLYKYGAVGFGPFVGFFTAWGYFICECFANVAYAVLVMSTMDYFFPGKFTGGSNWPSVIGASIITWLITALVLRGVEVSSTVQKFATAVTLAVMVIFIATVAIHFNYTTFTTNASATHNVASLSDHPMGSVGHQLLKTMMITLWMFGGVEGAVVMSGKARDPRQVPKATVIGFIVCLIMFALTDLLSLGAFSYGQLQKVTSPSTAYILTTLWHSVWGRNLITFALLVAVFSSWISWVQMLAELPQTAAEQDHTFPKIFAKVSKRDVPIASVLIATCIMEIIIIYAHFNNNAYQLLLTITGTMTVAPYMVSALYLIKLARNKESFPNNTKHKQATSLTIGILAFIYTVIMGYAAGINYIAISFIVYALGIPVYVWARKEQHDGKPVFTKGEWIFVIIIIVVALIGIWILAK